MKSSAGLLIVALALAAGPVSAAEKKAPPMTPGVMTTELQSVMHGWSAKKTILGKTVYNDKNESIGKVEDLIITPEKQASYAIISAGGFLKMSSHDVAVPTGQLKIENDKIYMHGADKESLKRMPEFRYMKK